MEPAPARVGISTSRGASRGVAEGLLLGALGLCTALPASAASSPNPLRGSDSGEVMRVEPDVTPALPRLGPGFVMLPSAGGAAACGPRVLAETYLKEQVLAAQAELDLDVELAILFAASPTGCGDLFYTPVKNDVLGIGYAHTDGQELFDREPDWALQGLAFLNDIPYWQEYPDELRTAFLHELGHRWAARVGARQQGKDIELTGRQGGHWSYFLDTGGSPLQGNAFEDDESWTTSTPQLRLHYSELDLYLMGLMEPHEVGPIRLLMDGEGPGLDCDDHAVTAASPPQSCEPKSLNGSPLTLHVSDVIDREGERIPAMEASPKQLRVAVFVVAGGATSWSLDSCRAFAQTLPEHFLDFAEATQQRMQLENVVGQESACEQILDEPDAPTLSAEGGCSLAKRGPAGGRALLVVALLLGYVGVRRRRAKARRNALKP